MTYTSNIIRSVTLLTFLFASLSCVHSGTPSSGPQQGEATKKSSPDDEGVSATNLQQLGQALQKDILFYKSLLVSPERPGAIASADLAQIRSLAALQTRHVIQNAILTVAAARLALAQQNLVTGEVAASRAEENNLERSAAQLDVKIANSIEKNPILAHPQALALLQKALEASPTTATFDAEVRKALHTHMQSWQAAATAFGLTVGTASQQAPERSGGEATVEEATNPVDPAGGSTDETLEGDSQNALDQAAALADKGDYKQAIKILAKSPPDSPAFQTARERIVQYSDQAVQNLRGRSASEFQNFQQVSEDPAAKLLYLKKSRAYLQDALKEYPDASMLATVRSNLDFVEKEISKVERQIKK